MTTDQIADSILAEHERRLIVGQIVVIRLSNECQQRFCGEYDTDHALEHEWTCDGCVGKIQDVYFGPAECGNPIDGHVYEVECLHGFEWYCSAELIPILTAAQRRTHD